MRRIARGIFTLAILAGLVYVGLQFYLKSAHAAGLVAAKLRAKLGVAVTVGSLEVDLNRCAACDLAIYETQTPSPPPFLTMARAETNLGWTDIAAGMEPTVITLRDAQLTLCHNRDGKLTTHFPAPAKGDGPMPEIQLYNATITVKREGQPDCVIHGIDAVMKNDAGRMILNGNVIDTAWGGEWHALGQASADGTSFAFALQSKGVHVTPEILRKVPFVPESVWKHFAVEGDTPVNFQLTAGQPKDTVHYRVELAPVNTRVFVPSIDLQADRASGKVLVEDNLVTLRDVRGRVADGELYVKSADLDFRGRDSRMKYSIEAKNLNLYALPASWRLPPRLGGLLSGTADLNVVVIAGRTIPTGSGEGRVDGATLGILPIPNYGLKIQADANGFRFEPRLK